MKLKLFLCAAFFALAQIVSVLAADQPVEVNDPVADYIARHKDALRTDAQKSEHVIKLEIDINNDGTKDLFLSSEKSCFSGADSYENKVYIWDLYLKMPDGRYALMDRKKSDDPALGEYVAGQDFDFDPEKIFG